MWKNSLSVKTGLLFGDTMEEGFPPGDVAAIAALWCHRVDNVQMSSRVSRAVLTRNDWNLGFRPS
jgi:hypothetical protein